MTLTLTPRGIVLLPFLLILKSGMATNPISIEKRMTEITREEENPSVTRLRNYLRIKTEQPHPEDGYANSIRWLRTQADEIGLDFTVYYMEPPNLFAVCLTWVGTNPGLKSVLLNSHMDVVPADSSKWTYPPYAAHKDSQGRIFARGAADMKSKTIAELEALRRLKLGGLFQPLRTIHMTVMPDEELAGLKGMGPFVKTEDFQKLNVGVDIDEGGGLDRATNIMPITVAEKNAWKFNVTAFGKPGHGSALPKYTAGQRLQVVIDRLMDYREIQYLKSLHPNSNHSLENLTTINLVGLGGFVADNVIPSQVWAAFDMRIAVEPDCSLEDMDEMLNRIVGEAELGSTFYNERVAIDFTVKSMETGRTATDDSNPWWVKLQSVCHEIGVKCVPKRGSAASDGRFVRDLGIPVFGLAPFPGFNVHGDNEYVFESDFLAGIDVYETFIRSFAMEPGHDLMY